MQSLLNGNLLIIFEPAQIADQKLWSLKSEIIKKQPTPNPCQAPKSPVLSQNSSVLAKFSPILANFGKTPQNS